MLHFIGVHPWTFGKKQFTIHYFKNSKYLRWNLNFIKTSCIPFIGNSSTWINDNEVLIFWSDQISWILNNSVVISSSIKTQTILFMLPKANDLKMEGFRNSARKISWLCLIHISKKNVNSPLGFVLYLWIRNYFVIII